MFQINPPKIQKQFHRRSTGLWGQSAVFTPKNSDKLSEAFFGQSVAIIKHYGKNDVTVLIGAPGQAKVYVFVLLTGNDSWEEQATLKPPIDFFVTESNFGGSRTLSLQENIAFVGCIHRDLRHTNTIFSIGFSTSDVSATGVDARKYISCQSISGIFIPEDQWLRMIVAFSCRLSSSYHHHCLFK